MNTRRILHLDDLARGLGWFSVSLGVAEVLAPGRLAQAIGLRRRRRLLRLYGMREIGAGIGLLLSRDPAPWLWARTGGDLLDIATLRTALRENNPHLGAARASMLSVLAVTALDVLMHTGETGHAPTFDYSDRRGITSGPPPRKPEQPRHPRSRARARRRAAGAGHGGQTRKSARQAAPTEAT